MNESILIEHLNELLVKVRNRHDLYLTTNERAVQTKRELLNELGDALSIGGAYRSNEFVGHNCD